MEREHMPNYKAVAIPFWAAILTVLILQVVPIHLSNAADGIEHYSSCTATLAVCSNEHPSTPGPNGIVRANINDHPVAGNPAYNRIVILLHWEPSTLQLPYCVRGYCPVVKAAAGGAYIGGGGVYHCPFDCYVETKNTDPYDPSFSLWQWWTARERSNGTIYDAMTGRPGL
jgi:hypothetical protein